MPKMSLRTFWHSTVEVCRVVDPSKKVPDLHCEEQDLLLEVVDLKREGSCQFNPFPRLRVSLTPSAWQCCRLGVTYFNQGHYVQT